MPVDFDKKEIAEQQMSGLYPYEFKWGKTKATLWQQFSPPSRPSSEELKIYKSIIAERFLDAFGLSVLILGSTCEFRQYFYDLGCHVTVVDNSKDYYEEISKELDNSIRLKIMTQEQTEFKFWHTIDFRNKFDIIIGDLAIGNVSPQDLDKFVEVMYKALKPNGIFIGKNLFTGVCEVLPISDLCKQYQKGDDPYAYFMYYA